MNTDNNIAIQSMILPRDNRTDSSVAGSLPAIATQTISCLNARRCSILQFTQSDDQGCFQVIYCANVPHSIELKVSPLEQAIASYLSKTEQPLLIKNSKFIPFTLPKNYLHHSTSLISVPLWQNNQISGAIIVEQPIQKKFFDESDLELLKLFATIASQALHITHLQNILKSKFVTLAVVREIQETQEADPHPTKLAKIVAKSFFKEVIQAGFSPPQIIETATEVLNLLHITLEKHRQRISRDD
ncbi:GAF domain-containing protein [Chroococcus sp. FPU101]|uniref:GAF domain-containing protein n=1 Tax=Chroococcus sp. FPU101 TaxID=1974212 RepID=UPI001A8F6EEF|nr:GAF domain-containing protein [Chroococcus sp. FPU101]GFE71789.1 putative GAF sensor protein [Chroococcus sp. FPU101]